METLADKIKKRFGESLLSCVEQFGETTIEISKDQVIEVCKALRDEPPFRFEQLIDLCGVDYLTYGSTEWSTEQATDQGFSRGRSNSQNARHEWNKPRFAVVYHLISYSLNQRVRVRVFVDEAEPMIRSVEPVWSCANWFEREAFDMFGIIFEGHPDLRRLLTDYGFIGHPFRKDFPVYGHVEMRYDETKKRVVYEPVNIEPRVLVPRVIRDDHRYLDKAEKES